MKLTIDFGKLTADPIFTENHCILRVRPHWLASLVRFRRWPTTYQVLAHAEQCPQTRVLKQGDTVEVDLTVSRKLACEEPWEMPTYQLTATRVELAR
jgi:hypothetical protein